MAESEKTHRVAIVGAGFAGFNAARELVQLVGATTEVVVINSTDYFLYLPLMPQVAGAEDRGPKHRANSRTRRAASRRWLRGILARELGQLIPLRGGVPSGWCQHPWPEILAAR